MTRLSVLTLFLAPAVLLGACDESRPRSSARPDTGVVAPRADATFAPDGEARTEDASARDEDTPRTDASEDGGGDASQPIDASQPMDAAPPSDSGSPASPDAGGRTPASGPCVRSAADPCESDGDCAIGGCGQELCYSPESGGGFTTCDCTRPPVVSCGCVEGACVWWR